MNPIPINEQEIVLRRVNIRFDSAPVGLVNEVKIKIERVGAGDDSMLRPIVAGYIIEASWQMLQNTNASIFNAIESMDTDAFGTLYLDTVDDANSFKITDVRPVYDFVLDGNGKFTGLTAVARRSATAAEVYAFLVNASEAVAETDALTFTTAQRGWSPVYYYMRPKSVYYKNTYNRTYFTWSESPSAVSGVSQNNWVNYFDHDTETFSAGTSVGPDKPGTDNHHYAAIEVAEDGHILVAYDQLRADGAAHNEGIRIMRSDNPEDISAFTQITVIEQSGAVLEGAYPHFVKRPNNEIWVIFRWRDSGMNVYHIWMAKSQDGGQTWGDGYPIAQISTNTDDWAYNTHAPGPINSDCRIIVNESNHVTYKTYKLLVIRSADGETWGNEQQTFKKNVITAGQITPAETDANLIIDQVPDNGLDYTFFRGCGVAPSGKFFALVTTDTGSGTLMYFMLHDGDGWQKKHLSFLASGVTSGEIVVYDDNTIDLFVRTVDKLTIERWTSKNRGDSWQKGTDVITANPDTLSYELVNNNYLDQGKLVYSIEDRHSNYHDLIMKFYKMGE